MRRKIDGVRESVQEAQQEGSQSASAAKAKLSSFRAAMGGGVKAYGKLKEDYKGAGTFSSPAAETPCGSSAAPVAGTAGAGGVGGASALPPELPSYSASKAAACRDAQSSSAGGEGKSKPWWLCCC